MKGTEVITSKLEKMTRELKTVINEAQHLLKTTVKPEDNAFKVARARFESTLKNAKEEALELEEEMVGKIKDTAHATDKYVRDHAWNVAGAVAGASLLVGLLVARGTHGGSRHDH